MSGGTLSGGTGQTASPGTPSRVWLVARIRSAGQAASSAATSSAASPTTCSQLFGDQQRLAVPEPVGDDAGQRTVGFFPDLQSGGHRRGDEIRPADRGQVHQPYPVGLPGRGRGTSLPGQSGLAGAARSGQRHQSSGGKQFSDGGQVGFTADQRGLGGQPATSAARGRRRAGIAGRRLRRPGSRRCRARRRRRMPSSAGSWRKMAARAQRPATQRLKPQFIAQVCPQLLVARSASACLPHRYSARMRCPRSRSRSG